MTDLLKRLRDVRWISPNVSEKKAEEVCLEAANEIEKLRTTNELLLVIIELQKEQVTMLEEAISDTRKIIRGET